MSVFEKSVRANIAFHSAYGDTYFSEPHYRPENKARVLEELTDIKNRCNGSSLIDIGCGMGFIIDLAKKLFPYIRGIDITPDMLKHVDLSGGDIGVQVGDIYSLPFPDGSFDVCTAYGVLHHLPSLREALRESARVLKKGSGIFFSDSDPNSYFLESISKLPSHPVDFVQREISAANEKEHTLADSLGIDVELVRMAECQLHIEKGFKEENLRVELELAGFTDIEFRYHWFLGEAKFVHDKQLASSAAAIRKHLLDLLPLTRHLYKYLGVTARRV